MRKLEVKIRQLIWSFIQSFKPTTYDWVKYKNKRYYIKSSLTGENVWNLFEKGNNEPIHRYIKGQDLKIIHSLFRFYTVFGRHMFFQWSNWQSIDIRNPLGTRLSYYNSGNIRFFRPKQHNF